MYVRTCVCECVCVCVCVCVCNLQYILQVFCGFAFPDAVCSNILTRITMVDLKLSSCG